MTLTCDVCGREFTARAGARYCAGKCRTIAYRTRRYGEQPKRPRPPLPDTMRRATHDLTRQLERLDRLTRDDRMARFRKHPLQAGLAYDLERAARALEEIRARVGLPSQPTDL